MAEIYVGNTGKNWYLSCEEASFSQSVADNTSTLVLVLYLRCESSAYTVSFDRRSAWIGINTYTPAYSHSGGKHELGRATYTFSHNADGTASFSVGYGISTSYALNGSGTYSRTIPTIPRASSISSISGNTLGSAITVNISRASPNFTHEITYTFGNITRTYTGQGTSCTFTPPLSDATQIPNAVSGTATIKVQTKSGSTNIGSAVSKTFTLNVPASVVPTFTSLSVARVDNGVPASWGLYVAGFSKATLTINGAAGAQGSTIKGYSITGANYASTKNTLTTGALPAGTLTFTGVITDSRGRTATKSASISVIVYDNPSLTLSAQRCNSAGTIDNNGTYVRVVPSYTFASVSGKNSIVSRKFEIVGTSYSNTTCNSGATCVIGAGAISTASSYTIKGTVTDALGRTATMSVSISTAMKTFNLKANGKGAAFGKMAESDNVLDVAWKLNVRGDIQLSGSVKWGQCPFPIGYVYISVNSTNPNTYFGGTWTRFGNGRVLVGVSENETEFNSVQKTGGHKSLQSHTHTVSGTAASSGNHTHALYAANGGGPTPSHNGNVFPDTGSSNKSWGYIMPVEYAGAHTHTVSGTAASTGGGNAQNLQPYITVYMFVRTA